ncbi:MAG: hypothetical protein E6G84_04380 [Alphaproteobacteria bacterium]|nr:MAG: hypothetical protein E6G84_04380 [Alphaproteobacteria bacterium]
MPCSAIARSSAGSSNLGSSNLGKSNLGKSNLGRSNLGRSNCGNSNSGITGAAPAFAVFRGSVMTLVLSGRPCWEVGTCRRCGLRRVRQRGKTLCCHSVEPI